MRDLPHADRSPLVNRSRVSIDHKQPLDAAQSGDDFLNHSLGKILLIGCVTQVLKWHYRNRGLIGQRRCCRSRRRRNERLVRFGYWTDKPVAAARQCLDPAVSTRLLAEDAA